MFSLFKKQYRRYESYQKITSPNGNDFAWLESPKEGYKTLLYGDFKVDPEGRYIELPYCTYSDYTGGLAERSNQRSIASMFDHNIYNGDGIWEVVGGFGTCGIVVTEKFYNNDIYLQEIMERMVDYPIVDEDDMYTLQEEIQEEDWDSWIKQDLKRLLFHEGIAYDVDTLKDDFLRTVNLNNIPFYCETAVSSFVNLDDVVKNWKNWEIKNES